MTASTSVIPGPSILLILGQTVSRGPRAGGAALAPARLHRVVGDRGVRPWRVGGSLPAGISLLSVAGALYFGWLGLRLLQRRGRFDPGDVSNARAVSTAAFTSGIAVALSNPKALIYIAALLPPFVDAAAPIVPQLVLLAAIAMTIDVIIAAVYIMAGQQLAETLASPTGRRWLDLVAGTIFVVGAVGVLAAQLAR